jgi:hypothetical protein
MDKEVESLIKTGMTEHFCRYQNWRQLAVALISRPQVWRQD